MMFEIWIAISSFETCATLWRWPRSGDLGPPRGPLAQPPLSQQIRKLEEILGYPLFVRTSRAVKLTAAGEIFLERARRTLRNVQEDIEEARSIARGEGGALR